MTTDHPLAGATLRPAVERAAGQHLGRPWRATGFTDLDERAAHRCGILHGPGLSVFAKLDERPTTATEFAAERAGLDLLSRRAGVRTPTPVGAGVLTAGRWTVLLYEALAETPPAARTAGDWRAIGHSLATLHGVVADRYGLPGADGFFGPLPQDNRPVPGDRWADFCARRRLLPRLRDAVDSGQLPADLVPGVERVVARLPELCGPEPRPRLLHGDAQQNNFVSTATGAVVIDPAPHFGHPEVDLALVDYFTPVPDDVFDAYRETRPVDPGFGERRELWRMHGYLAVVAVDGHSWFGRRHLDRLAAAVARYR